MSIGVEETDNVQVLREHGNGDDEITAYGAHCAADEIANLRNRLQRAEELLERAQPHIGHSGKTNIEERAQEADDLNREVTAFLGGYHE